MTTSVRSKMTITFWLKKMVILLKSSRGNIVVIHYFWASFLVSEFTQEYAEDISRYSWGTLEKILGIVPRNWFERTFRWKFTRISKNFVDIFSGFSEELVTRNSLELVTINSLDRVMIMSSEWVTRNSAE